MHRAILLGVLLNLICCWVLFTSHDNQCKKFIELGWDIPNTAFMRKHWRQMEQKTPFDGVMFKVEVNDPNDRIYCSQSSWDNGRDAGSTILAYTY
jgi:hypothetical protein